MNHHNASTVKQRGKNKFLGVISSKIVGIQYYEGMCSLGEQVFLERDSDNEHDPNAINVQNLDFVQIGNLPRQLVAWLSPLVDQGKISIEGEIPSENVATNINQYPLSLKLFLCPKGKDILKERIPQNDIDALHETIRKAFIDLDKHQNALIAEGLGERFSALLKRDVLPETHMLISLFPSRSRDFRENESVKLRQQILEHINVVSLGKPQHFFNLTVYPILSENGKKSQFLPLDRAIKAKQAEFSEESEGGSVSHISFVNRSRRPILLPEGDILVGAKQNRIINISIVVAAQAAADIPVSCVERGRWRYTSKTFRPDYVAPPFIRRCTMQTVNASRTAHGTHDSDQGVVWENVDSFLKGLQVESDTDNLTDAYKKSQTRLDTFRKSITLPSDARGIIVSSGGNILGLDMFDSAATLKRYWSKLSEAYFIEASLKEEKTPKTRKRRITQFLAELQKSIVLDTSHVGDGTGFIVQSQGMTGSGVWYNDAVCHLAAFPVDELVI